MEDVTARIGVIGAGSWGTALAQHVATKGFRPVLWAYEREVAELVERERENKAFLPGVTLSENIEATCDLKKAVSDRDVLVMVTPSNFMRAVAERMSGHISGAPLIATASKGIEDNTRLTMSQLLMEVFGDIPEENFAAISGPSFAKEVARGVPTAVTVASKSRGTAQRLQKILASPYFRVYTNNDIIGVEICGAIKNIIALAAGMVDGMKLGLNTRAALITRGMAEIKRLGLKMGAHPETFAGLAGMGDLILTCTGTTSRNHTVGHKIGEGFDLESIVSKMHMVAEGVENAKSVYNLSKNMEVEMPICHGVYHILYSGMPPEKALTSLMTRELKQEFDDAFQP